jgi:hypothetical protein
MKKTIIKLADFLLEKNKIQEICEYKKNKLTLISGMLQLDINSDMDTPDFVKISIREYGMSTNKYLSSEIIPIDDARELIIKTWQKIEEKKNWQFIDNYGLEEYYRFRNAYVSAFKGEKETTDFDISIDYSNKTDKIFKLTDKIHGTINAAMAAPNQYLHFNDDEVSEKIHAGLLIRATALVKTNNSFKAENFDILLSNIEAKQYGFNVSIGKKYNEKNIYEYLISQVKEPTNRIILSQLQLEDELPLNDNNSSVKIKKI